jgi:hypothetical protein
MWIRGCTAATAAAAAVDLLVENCFKKTVAAHFWWFGLFLWGFWDQQQADKVSWLSAGAGATLPSIWSARLELLPGESSN